MIYILSKVMYEDIVKVLLVRYLTSKHILHMLEMKSKKAKLTNILQ